MKRPRGRPTAPFKPAQASVRCPPYLMDIIDEYAEEQRWTRSRVIEFLLHVAVEQIQPLRPIHSEYMDKRFPRKV